MSCDIHAYGERRVEGLWVPTHPNEGADPGCRTIYRDQSYHVFALLAGVRNYNEWEPAFADRGLPSNVSQPVRYMYENMAADAHSMTWVDVVELLDHDWNYDLTAHGYVDPRTYADWVYLRSIAPDQYEPRGYAHGVSSDIRVVTEEEALGLRDHERVLVDATWQVPAWWVLRGFIGTVCSQLGQYAMHSNARVVMWFDN